MIVFSCPNDMLLLSLYSVGESSIDEQCALLDHAC